MELVETSRSYVVINTHKGLFRYNRLPFGISSAPGIFQRTMESLLQNIPAVVVYTDDILVTGTLDKGANSSACLWLKQNRCMFMAESVVNLGHRIDQEGLHSTEGKVKAVQDAPEPRNVAEVRFYLGLLMYYSKFLPKLAATLNPLYRLLHKLNPWHWGKKAFEASKQLLLSSRLLAHYDPQHALVLACDALPHGLGAVLSHRYPDGSEHPISYVCLQNLVSG